mmetsp:Transcript_69280/g.124908  ORF Transcript_69280/g.124908 Transcript_69280/m.124908 type:complete len:219 (+) Transcript_69280:324-980(+)
MQAQGRCCPAACAGFGSVGAPGRSSALLPRAAERARGSRGGSPRLRERLRAGYSLLFDRVQPRKGVLFARRRRPCASSSDPARENAGLHVKIVGASDGIVHLDAGQDPITFRLAEVFDFSSDLVLGRRKVGASHPGGRHARLAVQIVQAIGTMRKNLGRDPRSCRCAIILDKCPYRKGQGWYSTFRRFVCHAELCTRSLRTRKSQQASKAWQRAKPLR